MDHAWDVEMHYILCEGKGIYLCNFKERNSNFIRDNFILAEILSPPYILDPDNNMVNYYLCQKKLLIIITIVIVIKFVFCFCLRKILYLQKTIAIE